VERTRCNVIAAIRKGLIETGYHRLSLEQVAEDAGVTRVTIYRRFGSKLGLLEATAEHLAQQAQVVPGLRAAAAEPDACAAFRAMVAELCRFWSADPDLFRRLVGLAAVDPETRQVIGDREQWRHEQVAAFVHRLDAEGRIRPPFDADQATAAVAAVTGFPSCDDMATRMVLPHSDLADLLLALLSGVVVLD
jgi:AcrR family transcriptional regulator